MDERPPSLTPVGAEREPPPERHGRRAHVLPVSLGVLLGVAAIVAAVVLVRDGGGEAAPPAAPPAAPAPPPPEVLRIVFPEGFTRQAMAERITAVDEIAREERGIDPALAAGDYLAATRPTRLPEALPSLPRPFARDPKVTSFEGFLFPATYDFTEETVAPELVEEQLAAFGRAWSEVDLSYARSRNLTAYDVLIIASMIEGEVQVPRERALVAAVIYNRLARGMPLGIDATIRYGLDIPPTRAIRQSELEDPNPYNTRIHTGLPPTPINNPGLAALQAAAHPADVDYLYFVRRRDCRSHFFTASEEEFLQRLERPRC